MSALLIGLELIILQYGRFHMVDRFIPRAIYIILTFLFVMLLFVVNLANRRGWWLDRILQLERWWGFSLQRKMFRWLVSIVFFGGIIVLLFHTAGVVYFRPVQCDFGDMLPSIQQANQYLLQGESPFNKVYCPWGLPLVYFPLQLSVFLPAVWAGLDMRLLTIFFFLLLLYVIHTHLHRRGYPFMALLCSLLWIVSPVVRFWLLNIQIFPYLFLIALLFHFVHTKNWVKAAFVCGLLLAFRQSFYFSFPLFALLYWHEKRPEWRKTIGAWSLGLFLGFLPALFYLPQFLHNLLVTPKYYLRLLHKNVFLDHSFGFMATFRDHPTLGLGIQIILFILIYVAAWKLVKIENIWLFFSLAYANFIFFQRYLRPEEYYVLPVVVAAAFALPGEYKRGAGLPRATRWWVGTVAIVILIFLFYPQLSAKHRGFAAIPGTEHSAAAEFSSAKGKVGVVWRVGLLDRLSLPDTLSLALTRDTDAPPTTISVQLNERTIWQGNVAERRQHVDIPRDVYRQYILKGANYLAVYSYDVRHLRVRCQLLNR